MLSICMGVKRVHGKTNRDPEGRMENSVFTALAHEVVNAGLVQEIDQALLYIIPAFAKFGLLPGSDSPTAPVASSTAIAIK